MKKIELFIITMLFVISYAYADGYRTDEDHWEKVRQMDEMAERFKAETGFTGSISYDLNMMCIGYYEGKFAGIQITAEADTASFRSAFEQIMDKVLPYTFAKREQLVRSRITNNHGIIETDYYQQVNGYRVEGIGRLSIAYEVGRNAFAIGNGTVELPEGDVSAIITKETAVNKAKEYHSNRFDLNIDTLIPYANVKLEFSNPDSTQYSLRYFVIIGGMGYYVDADTGSLFPTQLITHYLSTLSVEGRMYSPYSNTVLTHTNVGLQNMEIELNGSIYHTDIHGLVQ